MRIIIALMLIAFSISSFAQNPELRQEKGHFYVNDKKTPIKDFVSYMQSDSIAYELALDAQSDYNKASGLGFFGGFLIGWPIGTWLGGKRKPEWVMAGVGVVFLLFKAPLVKSYKYKMHVALELYGEQSKPTSQLDFEIMPGRMGLVYSF